MPRLVDVLDRDARVGVAGVDDGRRGWRLRGNARAHQDDHSDHSPHDFTAIGQSIQHARSHADDAHPAPLSAQLEPQLFSMRNS